ncbi:MAG: hypothetical protein ABI123_04720 [Ginsengibacter sp.]|jgi:hypothetical protein
MEELIKKLQETHGLTPQQSQGILGTITGYIKEKFPMVSGAIDNLFQSGTTPSAPGTTPGDVTTNVADDGNMLDKISDFVPGATGQKIEDFAKDKLGGFFGKEK